MTLYLVDSDSLVKLRYIEHGAFYSIFVLSIILYISALVELPEYLSGLASLLIISASIVSSVRFNRQNKIKKLS